MEDGNAPRLYRDTWLCWLCDGSFSVRTIRLPHDSYITGHGGPVRIPPHPATSLVCTCYTCMTTMARPEISSYMAMPAYAGGLDSYAGEQSR